MELRTRIATVALSAAAVVGITACDPAPPTVEQVVKPAPTAAKPAASVDAMSQQVVNLTNSERAKAGLGPVTVDSALVAAAQGHSNDQAARNTMTHTGSNGSSAMARMQAAGFNGSIFGENVAYGYRTADTVMNGWMNSSGHRANILNGRFTKIGVAIATGGNGSLYWTMDLGG